VEEQAARLGELEEELKRLGWAQRLMRWLR
jgi:hypothetical protein